MVMSNPDFLMRLGGEQAPEFQELESPDGELHLRFYTPSGDEFALPATGIKEVLSPSPDRITPVPNVSPLLLGTLNVRGRVVWVADLGQFLGDAAMLNTDRQEISVIAVEDQDILLGLAVDRVVGMDWMDVEQLQMADNVPDSVAPFLRGEWPTDTSGKALRLLDQVAILRSARWAA
jgi:twitching motility protein PilI